MASQYSLLTVPVGGGHGFIPVQGGYSHWGSMITFLERARVNKRLNTFSGHQESVAGLRRGRDLRCRSPHPSHLVICDAPRLSSRSNEVMESSSLSFHPPSLSFPHFPQQWFFICLCLCWSAAFILWANVIWRLLLLWKHRHLHLGLFPNELLLQLVSVLVCYTLQASDSPRLEKVS